MVKTRDGQRVHRLLVIDDDPGVAAMVRALFEGDDTFEVIASDTGRDGLLLLSRDKPDLVLLDNVLPDTDGLSVLRRIRAYDARLPVLFITAQGTSDTAIEAMKLCAFDFLPKPLDLDQLEHQIRQAAENRRLMRVPVQLPSDSATNFQADRLVGQCPAMQEVYKSMGRVAAQSVPVLLIGETGTGKELVARAIYQHGSRAGAVFRTVDCMDFNEASLEAEIFGQEAGTTSPGSPERVGKLEQCRGGTLLLEDIGAMSFPAQSRLLRFLRTGQFERVGGNETLSADVKVLLTSSEMPEDLVRDRRLREDLFYTVSAFTIRLPPLRDRGADLRLLVEYFVGRLTNYASGLGAEVPRVAPDALAMMSGYHWPGNVAELQSVLRRALLETKGVILVSEFLRRTLLPPPPNATSEEGDQPSAQTIDWAAFVEQRLKEDSQDIHAQAIEAMERAVISEVLKHTGGNQARAARVLGITRTSLRKKTHSLGIRVQSTIQTARDDS